MVRSGRRDAGHTASARPHGATANPSVRARPVTEPKGPAPVTASFIVRVWREPSRQAAASEWRGTVTRVGQEATLAFRTLEGVERCLRRLLPEADED